MATMNITISSTRPLMMQAEMRDGLAHVNRGALTAEQARENTDAQVRLAARVQALRPIDRGEKLAIKNSSEENA